MKHDSRPPEQLADRTKNAAVLSPSEVEAQQLADRAWNGDIARKRKRRALLPEGGDDNIYTPDDVALAIVEHFRPAGHVLEPCAGEGAFLRAFFEYDRGIKSVSHCEISEYITNGSIFVCPDFLKHPAELAPTEAHRYDWIITNPPWSKMTDFLVHAMKLADNIVFLALMNSYYQRCRMRHIRAAGFGIVQIKEIAPPPKPWKSNGMSLGAAWLRRGWTGSTDFIWL